MEKTFTCTTKIWVYEGDAGWHFLSLPAETTEEIEFYFAHEKRGWGSLPVTVTIGKSTWKTSIFTDKKRNSFLLPLKAEVRKKENLQAGQTVTYSIHIDV